VRRILLAFLLLSAAACKPGVTQCTQLLGEGPDGEVPQNVTVTTTPAGTAGCRATFASVPVIVEANRRGLHWERGRIWVAEKETTEASFRDALREEKIRMKVRDAGDRIRSAVRGLVRGLSDSPTSK